ncbi:MAG TPA: hypothetical protein VHH11_16490 [Gammaproteobacteria bacterium]|nr:hypothetical protein [Gammaproteobacteria bacterium]
MKMFRRLFAVALLVASVAGLQSTSSAATATVAPPVHSATACCWLYMTGRWICIPC